MGHEILYYQRLVSLGSFYRESQGSDASSLGCLHMRGRRQCAGSLTDTAVVPKTRPYLEQGLWGLPAHSSFAHDFFTAGWWSGPGVVPLQWSEQLVTCSMLGLLACLPHRSHWRPPGYPKEHDDGIRSLASPPSTCTGKTGFPGLTAT